ncbi:methionyl-tRNA formyltransferase [Tuanshanicoccus lijuaniae]|uniref:methionyl-tRNA formyltransferase n=1 Tax=Aerococcaceae bacterium zg-1292 TaxID=2774330 RepID=UPI0019384669|nr:methionyl-tRNA formyltransferase [Aerococcaceae bacterium zg-1292]QQA37417.1 methionyl-tRNA formyltransferase [Aerococcaceae bacterium zg-1292]
MEKIIFMGTPQFSATVLDGILSHGYDVVAVVTQPDRPVGRKRVITPSPVKAVAVTHNIPVYQPEKLSGSPEMAELLTLDADIIVTAAYGQFVPTKLLKGFRFPAINVHASLLPKYRGGAPIHYAIWQGEKETGVSIMYMEREMDAGDVLAQQVTPIGEHEDVADLFERLAVIGRDLLLDTLPKLFADTITPQPQDAALVTYSPTISKEQEQIDWQMSAQAVHNHVRAFRPFPSTYTGWNNQRLKIWAGRPVEHQTSTPAAAGTIIAANNHQLLIQCGEGVYAIESLQPSGKKRMDVATFLHGVDVDSLIGQQFTWCE